MSNNFFSLAKAIVVTGVLSLSLAACVSAPVGPASSSQAVSSVPVSSSSVAVSSVMPSSSSVVSSSSQMSSSSVMVSSSASSPALDCSTVDVSVGSAAFFNRVVVDRSCSDCHRGYDPYIGMFPGTPDYTTPGGFQFPPIDPNNLIFADSSNLGAYIAARMAKTRSFRDPATDTLVIEYGGCDAGETACFERAAELANYINSFSSDPNWCAGLVDSGASSSVAPASSSSEMMSSSSVASEDFVVLYAVNAGGGPAGFMSADGISFTGDFYFTGGSIGTTADTINNTVDDTLYQSERYGDFSYNFALMNGTYDVAIYLNEPYYGANGVQGNRVFDVSAEGNVLISNYDPLVASGHDVANIIELTGIVVSDELLTLDFAATVGEASVSAIVVRGAAGSVIEVDPGAGNGGTIGNAPVPGDCPAGGMVTENDFVLFDGGMLPSITSNPPTVQLHQNWILDEVWRVPQGAIIEVVDTASGSAIRYGNAGTFSGFKFSPPLVFGARQQFKLSGVDLYIELSAGGGAPQFGMRVIKPGEDEGNGGAATTSWVRNANGQQDFVLTQGCSLLSLSVPPNWDIANQAADRFILEVKDGWGFGSELRVRRMVIKNYEAL